MFEITRKSPKTDTVNGTSKEVGATYQLVATGLDSLTTSGTVNLIFPEGTARDTNNNLSNPETITAAVDQSNEQIVVDFIQPVWEQSGTVTPPATAADNVVITIIGSDKYLATCTLKQNGNEIDGIEVL